MAEQILIPETEGLRNDPWSESIPHMARFPLDQNPVTVEAKMERTSEKTLLMQEDIARTFDASVFPPEECRGRNRVVGRADRLYIGYIIDPLHVDPSAAARHLPRGWICVLWIGGTKGTHRFSKSR